MKKVLASFVIITILLLTGCGAQSAESAMKELFKAGVDRDYDKLYDYFSFYYEDNLDHDDLEEIADDITYAVREVGGLKNINIKEVNRKELNPELVRGMDDWTGKDWYVTLVEFPGYDDDIMAIFMKKSDGQFYIVDEDYYDEEDLSEDFFK